MIVVDTNVLAYFFLRSDFTAAAEALYARDSDWVAPRLWRSEFRNVLTGCMRREGLALEKAQSIQAAAERLLAGREFESDSDWVLRLVSESQCSAYDCEFVALAQRLGLQLATADAKLRREFPTVAVAMDMAAL